MNIVDTMKLISIVALLSISTSLYSMENGSRMVSEGANVNFVDGQKVYKKKVQHWLTNEPYLEDEYSQKYAATKEAHSKQKDIFSENCFAKHKDSDSADFWKAKCQMLAISKQEPFDMPRRGTLEFVKANYLSMQKLSGKAFGVALKGTLEKLSEVREKTRVVGGIISSELKEGELSYEQVNSEICLIEKVIGRLSSKDYCHL